MHLDLTRTTDARGRNGWFTLDHGTLWLNEPQGNGWRACLELRSQASAQTAPVMLWFTGAQDMRTIGQALLDTADLLDPQPQQQE